MDSENRKKKKIMKSTHYRKMPTGSQSSLTGRKREDKTKTNYYNKKVNKNNLLL